MSGEHDKALKLASNEFLDDPTCGRAIGLLDVPKAPKRNRLLRTTLRMAFVAGALWGIERHAKVTG